MSKPPTKSPIAPATVTTTIVSLIVSCLVGQVTFLSSATTSLTNRIGGKDIGFWMVTFAINKNPLRGMSIVPQAKPALQAGNSYICYKQGYRDLLKNKLQSYIL